MIGFLGQLARRLGIYGPVRTIKSRLDRLSPSKARLRRDMIRFYSQFVPPDRTVFDVGANLGSRCDVFLALGAKVIAVEPQPMCQEVLTRLFGRNPRFTLVPKALGDAPGEARMYLADTSGLSTLSKDWIEKTTRSGRFAGHDWSRTITVPITTMDTLIAEHGLPAFCKIDVEGFELSVLKGLSTPIQAVSFELATEAADNAVRCIELLAALGPYRFNYSNSESMTWERPAWVDAPGMIGIIRTELDPMYFGDVYASLSQR